MGRVLSYTDEAGQTVTYTYDSVGNKLIETKGKKTTSYTYDAAGNVTGVTYQMVAVFHMCWMRWGISCP